MHHLLNLGQTRFWLCSAFVEEGRHVGSLVLHLEALTGQIKRQLVEAGLS